MKIEPFFSVVITVFNKEKHIDKTVNSVLKQSYPQFEVIIIDDGSTDRSREIIESFDDNRLKIYHQENQGASAARNKGIALSTYDFVALLDGDDLWQKNYLESIVQAINKFPNQHIYATAVAHRYLKTNYPLPYTLPTNEKISVVDYFEGSKKHSLLTSSSVVFRKAIIEKTGDFDEQIASGQDTDMWIKMGAKFPVVFINDILVYYVYDRKSLSNTTRKLSTKPNFANYTELEATNKDAKRFINRNRYSLALASKLQGDKESYKKYKREIDMRDLTVKKRLLLTSPRFVLTLMLKLKGLDGRKKYYE